ncbi:LOW QUALITY PROTEIN: hypothetical protein QTO34_008616 [Cnephaeus nilssonii]|uniref:Peptidase M12B domain-containing protein n=1 Tax=Cnephaeus nilssonii TaxID=3371016 RepID=A0AA40IAL7_CNENI|nr:LOW QUALITY PROTEIN: hypothetical protein QTO34_008616 [Eptesicus nilssonii]
MPLLLLGLWVVLGSHPVFSRLSLLALHLLEVVIPRKELHHGKALLAAGWLSYSLRDTSFHMRRKRLFWPGQLVVMTQDDQGALQVDYPFFPLDCYYLGYLEDVPLSMVTVDTCYGGLEGIMKVDDLAYEIKPLKDSQRFEHIVSQIVADTNATGPMSTLDTRLRGTRCSLTRTQCSLQGQHLIVIYNTESHPDMTNYSSTGPFAQNYANKYSTIFLYIQPYCEQRGAPINLIITIPIMRLHLQICFSGSTIQTLFIVTIIASHQIGALFGLWLDTNDCVCQRRATCIMYSRYPVLTDSFSNCSFQHTQHILNNNNRCLFREIVYSNSTLTPIRCGNSVVEDKEQCDCGTFKQCYTNPYWTVTAALHLGAFGKLLQNCTYTPAGRSADQSRTSVTFRVLQGEGHAVPQVIFICKMEPRCTEDGYCYHGNCTDRSMHCKEIFGEGALSTPDCLLWHK